MAWCFLGRCRARRARARWFLLALVLGAAVGAACGAPGDRPGGLSGIVLDPLGHVLPDVEIRIAPLGSLVPPVLATRTDRQGRFVLRGVAPGVYRLVAIKGGYAVLVDRIDTFLHRTLELVLHPVGPERVPGRDAPDRSWALRLPRRDVLEDAAPAALAGLPVPPARPRFSVALAPASLDTGRGGEGNGVDVGVRARFDLAPGGGLAVDLHHRGARGRDGLEDQVDRLSLALVREWRERGLATDVRISGLHRRARREAPPGESGPWGELRGRVLDAGLRGSGTLGAWRLSVAARSFRGEQPATRTSGRWVSAGAELHRSAGPRGELVARAMLGDARDAIVPGTGPSDFRVMPALAPPGNAFLDTLTGTSLDLGVEASWRVRDEARVSVAWRGVTAETGGTRWTGWTVLDWRLPGGWLLGAAGGVAAGGDSASEPALRFEVGRERGSWSWSLRRSRQAGPVPGAGALAPVPLLLAARAARLESWEGGVSTRLGSGAAAVLLRGETGRVEGAVAPRIPGDLPLVPVLDDARARFVSVSGALALSGGATRVEVTWQRLRDRSPGALLLAGSEAWTDRHVRLSQRIGAFSGRGYACEVLVLVGRSRIEGAASVARSPGRLAFLHRDRLAGGLRVAF